MGPGIKNLVLLVVRFPKRTPSAQRTKNAPETHENPEKIGPRKKENFKFRPKIGPAQDKKSGAFGGAFSETHKRTPNAPETHNAPKRTRNARKSGENRPPKKENFKF